MYLAISGLNFTTPTGVLDMVGRILALVLALTLHEWAHALAAVKCGDPTPKLYGRLSVNPLRHFDPFGFIMILVANFGFGKPVPVNSANFRHPRRDAVWVSLAGVITNLILAIIFAGVYTCIATFAPMFMTSNYFGYFVMILLYLLVMINISLMIFNLFPIYPLDGFRLVEVCTRYNNPYRQFMYRYGNWILMGILLVSIFMNFLYELTGIIAFRYLDISSLVGLISNYVLMPITKLWGLLWGLFI